MILITLSINILIFIDYFNTYFFSDELTFFFDALINPSYNLIHDFNGKYYRPIPILLMNVIFLVFGNNPVPFHVVSLVLHLINLFLIYLISRKLLKKKLSPFLTISIMMLLSCIYYEIFFWVATYFELLFVAFGLISVYYFLKYLETDKWNDFLASVLFISFSVLSKETGLFLIPLFGFFELTGTEGIKLFIRKKSLKYLSFLPIVMLFVYVRLATNRFFTTIQSFLEPLKFALLIGGGILLIPFYLWMKKFENSSKKFSLLFALVYTAPLFFHRTSRIFYFSCVAYSILLVSLFLDKHDYKILHWLKQINFRKMKTILLVLTLSGLIAGSAFFLQHSKNIYKTMGTSMDNLSKQIALMNPISAQKHVYILYLPCFGPYYFGFAEQEIRQNLLLIAFQDYDINTIYIYDPDPRYLLFDIFTLLSPYDYINSIGAEPRTVSMYNELTQNSSNLMLLYLIDFQCVFNISGVVIN